MQLRAPGSPVIIVGTHLDMVSDAFADDMEKKAAKKYCNPKHYPKVKILLIERVVSMLYLARYWV